MNPKKYFQPVLSRFFLTFVCGSLLAALPADAQISLVNTGSLDETANQTSYTLSFDAGNGGSATKLIVSAGTESGAEAIITGITYNGQALTLIPNTGNPDTGRNRGIWYLDTPFSGGPADIVVSGDGITSFNHMRLGVASISGSAPGAAIGNIAPQGSVALNVPVNDSFVFAAYAGNLPEPISASAALPPLTPIYGVTNDSANMAAGYENLVPAGLSTYSFSSLSSPQSSAAAFVPASASPAIVSRAPIDDASGVSVAADLVATFSEPVVAGTGNIELREAGGALVESFNVTISDRLTFSGATLTINPTSDLTLGVGYYILIPATAVIDTTGGDAFAGISDPTAWSFDTIVLPSSITFLNKAVFTSNVQQMSVTTFTYETTFDPLDTADALVLMFATEAVAPSATVFFGSQEMTQAVVTAGNNPVAVYYLNNPSVESQTVSVTINLAASGNINGMGFTIFALDNSENLGIVPTAAVTNNNDETPLSIDINVPDAGSFVVAGYNNSSGSGGGNVVPPLTLLHSGDFFSTQGAFGYEEDVAAGNQTYGFTTGSTGTFTASSAAVAFAGITTPTNTFASWIGTFSGLGGLTAVGDDPDGDGNDNGVENFFGTNPGTFSQGLLVGTKSGNTFTFTHPQNATPASDLTASYKWTKDLASFLASGATDGAGTTVDFTTQENFPSPGITTVTATVTGTAASKLFVRVNVTQP